MQRTEQSQKANPSLRTRLQGLKEKEKFLGRQIQGMAFSVRS